MARYAAELHVLRGHDRKVRRRDFDAHSANSAGAAVAEEQVPAVGTKGTKLLNRKRVVRNTEN
jgi:hypothetical protein